MKKQVLAEILGQRASTGEENDGTTVFLWGRYAEGAASGRPSQFGAKRREAGNVSSIQPAAGLEGTQKAPTGT